MPKKKTKSDTRKEMVKKYAAIAKKLNRYPTRADLADAGYSRDSIRYYFVNLDKLQKEAKKQYPNSFKNVDLVSQLKKPKVLIYDIETAPILGYVWSLWDQNVGLNQIKSDWHVLSWSAKWLDSDEVMYMDNRDAKDIEDDKKLLKGIWKLLDEADVVITQNGKSFDEKKLNARFIINGFPPPSTSKHIDTKRLAKKHFGFTSTKLEYMTKKLGTKVKKSSHANYPGFELWKACLAGDLKAWKEMEEYNKIDVLSLEQLYKKMIPWDGAVDFNWYHDELTNVCKCGSTEFRKAGFHYTATGKFQKYACKHCGSETRSATNLMSKEKKASLRRKTR